MAIGVRILGAPSLRVSGRDVEVPGGKVGALLAMLALHPGRAVTSSDLCDAIWGEDPPANAANALQALVSRLRRIAGPDTVEATPGGYRLAASRDDVDAVRFADLVERGTSANRAQEPLRAARLLASATELWSGPLLGGRASSGVLAIEAVRLDELRAVADEELLDARLAEGRHESAVAEAERLVAERPLRERRWAQLIVALYRSGRQADALRAYQRLRQTLVEELGIEPSRPLADLERRVLDQDPSLTAVAPPPDEARRTNLAPAPVPELVGRSGDIKAVAAAVETHRVTVLLGPGGVGKTSVARASVDALAADVAVDGAFLVDLSRAAGLEAARVAVANAIGGGDREAPADRLERLAGADVLVILDACEHLGPDAGALAAELLEAGPRVRLMLTSRRRLLLPVDAAVAERTIRPLDPGDSILLLRRRAEAAGGGAGLGSDDDLLELAEALDHLPLAIELAAARTRYLSTDEVRRRLSDQIAVLSSPSPESHQGAGGRHSSLAAVLDTSVDLLGDDAAVLYRWLAMVPGPFSASTAEALAADVLPSDVALGALVELVDHSLLDCRADADGPRYRYLDTVRAHATARLQASGEEADARRALVRWAVEWSARLDFDAPDETVAVRAARSEAEAIAAALDDAEGEDKARITVAMWQWWEMTAQTDEGTRRLREVTEQPASTGVECLPAAHFALGRFLDRAGDRDGARRETSAALDLARARDDHSLAARALATLAYLDIGDGRIDEARRLTEEATSAADRSGDVIASLAASNVAAYLAYSTGRRREAAARWEAAAHEAGTAGFVGRRAILLGNLGVALDSVGEAQRALGVLEEAIEFADTIGDRPQAAQSNANLITVLRSLGRTQEAAALAERLGDELIALGDERSACRVLGHLVSLALESDDRLAAHTAAIRLTEIGRRREWPVELLLGLRAQGQVAMAYGNPAEALPLYRAALAKMPAESYDDTRGITLSAIGEAQLALGDTSGAIASFEQAREVLLRVDVETVDDIDELLRAARAQQEAATA